MSLTLRRARLRMAVDPTRKLLGPQARCLSAGTKPLEMPPQYRNLALYRKSQSGYSVSTFRNACILSADVHSSCAKAGLMVYVNGYTGPKITDRELKRLISVHGGEIR